MSQPRIQKQVLCFRYAEIHSPNLQTFQTTLQLRDIDVGQAETKILLPAESVQVLPENKLKIIGFTPER